MGKMDIVAMGVATVRMINTRENKTCDVASVLVDEYAKYDDWELYNPEIHGDGLDHLPSSR